MLYYRCKVHQVSNDGERSYLTFHLHGLAVNFHALHFGHKNPPRASVFTLNNFKLNCERKPPSEHARKFHPDDLSLTLFAEGTDRLVHYRSNLDEMVKREASRVENFQSKLPQSHEMVFRDVERENGRCKCLTSSASHSLTFYTGEHSIRFRILERLPRNLICDFL
jgi:hypothetical protein